MRLLRCRARMNVEHWGAQGDDRIFGSEGTLKAGARMLKAGTRKQVPSVSACSAVWHAVQLCLLVLAAERTGGC